MFMKHIGKQGDRKLVIVFREVPGEEHMCLVVFPEVMPTHMHDSLMKVVESVSGQQSENLADALHSNLFQDGRPMLVALHSEGMLKKVQTETVVVTPATNASCTLRELNSVLRQMRSSNEALEKMADIDKNAGISGYGTRRDDYGREVKAPPSARTGLAGSNTAAHDAKVIGDHDLAVSLQNQAAKMRREGDQLLAESNNLLKQAQALLPAVAPAKSHKATKEAKAVKEAKAAKAAKVTKVTTVANDVAKAAKKVAPRTSVSETSAPVEARGRTALVKKNSK